MANATITIRNTEGSNSNVDIHVVASGSNTSIVIAPQTTRSFNVNANLTQTVFYGS